jgi:trans-2,3-dihydro-3-hydroxyanthranilic acid synthase
MVGIPRIDPYALPAPADLPPNVAPWVADPQRAALLVHDMQRYFLRPFDEAMARRFVGNAVALTERARTLGMPVAYTMQPGSMTPGERGLLADFWGPGMQAEPAERDVIEPLAPVPGDEIFTKWRYSAFFRTGLLAWLRRQGRDQLVVCGVYGHVGVLATALEAFTHDVQPFLVADAVADFSAAHHRQWMDYAAQNCAVLTTAAETLS